MRVPRPTAFPLDEVRYEPDAAYPGEADELAAPERHRAPRCHADAARAAGWACFVAALGILLSLGHRPRRRQSRSATSSPARLAGLVRAGAGRRWPCWRSLAIALREIAALMRLRRINAHPRPRA